MTTPRATADRPVALVGGAEFDPEILNILQRLTDVFIAADGGADHLVRAGITPRQVIGDMDSISARARQDFAHLLVPLDAEDTTDLEKVLARVEAPVILGAGFLGGRLDHTMAALNVLARFSDKPLILLSETDCCLRCPDAGLALSLPVGTAFAVLPMDAVTATSSGLHWDMDAMALHPAGFVSSSNRTAAPEVRLHVTGPAIVTLPVAQLSAAIAAVRAG